MNLIMPAEYYGETTNGSDYVKSKPRKWTTNEIDWVKKAVESGHSMKAIAQSIGRTEISVFVKMKRLGKKLDTYNDAHRTLKYDCNKIFLEVTNPKTVLDLYAANSYYKQFDYLTITDNDKDERFETMYHDDALKLLCKLYANNQKFDVIDLDPYGSAYECFDLAFKMARKGIAISFGEWGHKRWKRFDFVRPRYGITNLDNYVPEKFVEEIQRIAAINHKVVTVIESAQYSNFLRIYFKIDKIKITEQWDK